jgi:hypothetical protein
VAARTGAQDLVEDSTRFERGSNRVASSGEGGRHGQIKERTDSSGEVATDAGAGEETEPASRHRERREPDAPRRDPGDQERADDRDAGRGEGVRRGRAAARPAPDSEAEVNDRPPVELRSRPLLNSDRERTLCQQLQIGSEPWSRDAESWLKQWLWEAPQNDRGHTILFFDGDGAEPIGFVTWRIRKEHIHDGEPKRKAIQIHFMGLAGAYHGAKSTLGCSVATAMFERALDAGEAAGGPLPVLIDVENENTHARDVYDHWLFEQRKRKPRKSSSDRTYLDLWRPPRADPEDAT